MTASSSKTGLVPSRYAAVLLDMAAEAGSVEKIEADMRDLGAMIAGSADLKSLILNPLTDRAQQGKAIAALAQAAKFQPMTVNFLGVLAANGRLPMLEGVTKAFQAELIRRRGEITAKVQTAYALTSEQTKALQDQLGKAMGSHVTLDVEVNNDLLGGMIVTVGSKQIDSSVKNKLKRLKRAMSQGKAA